MSELIEIRTAIIGGEKVNAVSARDLYIGLNLSLAHWAKWSNNNIVKNTFFAENMDWVGFTLEVNGNETRDFAVSVEMAKHLAMMAKTPKAHDYRNYFIECEKKANSTQKALTPAEMFLQMAQLSVDLERRQLALEETVNQLDAKIEDVKAKATMSPNEHYSIAGYASLRGLIVNVNKANVFGRMATKFSKEHGYEILKAHSELFGTVNTYHLDVLTELFEAKE
jgi:phage anti-repressor protein